MRMMIGVNDDEHARYKVMHDDDDDDDDDYDDDDYDEDD